MTIFAHRGSRQHRVMFFLNSMAGGGAERVVIELLRNLDRDRFDLSLALNRHTGEYVALIPADVDVIDLSPHVNWWRIPARVLELKRVVAAHRPDILIAGLEGPNSDLMRAAPFLSRECHLIVTEHNNLSMRLSNARGGLVFAIKSLEIRVLYRWAHQIVAVSQGVRDDLVKEFGLPDDRITVIYNPVDVDRIRQAALACCPQTPGSGDSKTVVAVGRLIRQKAFDDLINAFSLVRNEVDCSLIILGQGPLRTELETQVARLGLSEHVWMPGFVKNPWAFMANSDVYVSSSHWEGFHMTITEAMACGTPVVATDCDYGPREIIDDGKNGLLVPINDVEALAGAIVKVLCDEELRASLGREGRRRARDFDSPAVAREYEGLLEELIQW